MPPVNVERAEAPDESARQADVARGAGDADGGRRAARGRAGRDGHCAGHRVRLASLTAQAAAHRRWQLYTEKPEMPTSQYHHTVIF